MLSKLFQCCTSRKKDNDLNKEYNEEANLIIKSNIKIEESKFIKLNRN